jgi:hypothetical protein
VLRRRLIVVNAISSSSVENHSFPDIHAKLGKSLHLRVGLSLRPILILADPDHLIVAVEVVHAQLLVIENLQIGRALFLLYKGLKLAQTMREGLY